MELFIFARFHARPGHEATVAEALREVIAPTRGEPGCLAIHDHSLDVNRAERIV
jgi:quinol monooxygenase YgiN